jgi:hypothetical protein
LCTCKAEHSCVADDGTITCCDIGQRCLNGSCADICTGEVAPCSDLTPCGEGNCGCYFTAEEGPTVCGNRSCGATCTTSDDCDPGSFCSNTCCGLTCMPLCGGTSVAALVSGGGSPDLP